MHQQLVASCIKPMCVLAGRGCKEFKKGEHGFPDEEAIGQLLQNVDVTILVKTLVMGNAINASKITNSITSLASVFQTS
jgi:hypothetical protein